MSKFPLIIAHRGASGLVGQDNTLAAFEFAIDLGCDMAELDVRQTLDGQLVCFHDADVDGVAVSAMTLAELRHATQSAVPVLANVLALCRGKLALDIELKDSGFEEQLVRELANYADNSDIVLTSFKHDVVRALVTAKVPMAVGLLLDRLTEGGGDAPETWISEFAEQVVDSGAAFIAPHWSLVCPAFMAHPVIAPLKALVWTVNEVAEMRRLMAFGVDGIISDRPDYLLAMHSEPRLTHVTYDTASSTSVAIRRVQGRVIGDTVIPTRQIRIADNAVDELDTWLASVAGNGSTAVVVDSVVYRSLGTLISRLSAGITIVLNDDMSSHLVPSMTHVETVMERAHGCTRLVAVGSGVVNDIAKYAAHRLAVPYIVIPTAASMNGYTSSIAALLVNGLKSTVPTTPPAVVLCEPSILTTAPTRMTRAGYADLLSKGVSEADWRLSSYVVDADYCPRPGQLVAPAIAQCIAVADGIGAGEVSALRSLIEALVLSGFSMTIAGSSAPASGGEHLISHYWDMQAYASGTTPELHGLQVALGTLMTAELYQRLRAMSPSEFRRVPRDENGLPAIHGRLWPMIVHQAQRQLLSKEMHDQRLATIRECWDRMWTDLDSVLMSPDVIRGNLQRAGVPTTLSELGIDAQHARHAFVHAADIRDRYTVLHLARDIGYLDAVADDVVATVAG